MQPGVPAAGESALFGANQARDLQVAGQTLGQASDSLFALYERKAKEANDIGVQSANNRYTAGEREILRTGPDAYYARTGADAIDGAAAATGNLTKLKDRILGQAPNDYQRQKLGPILDAHLAASADDIARYADEQRAVYGRNVALAAIETSRADAAANPDNLTNAMARAEGATRALYQGQAPEVVENEARKAGASVVSAAIGNLLARNDPSGVRLFRQFGDRLDPRARRALGAAAETLSNTTAAMGWLRDRSARLAAEKAPAQSPQSAPPAPTGDPALDAVNAASPAALPPPVTSWGGRLLDQEGVAGHREQMAEIEERRRALTALNEREFAGNPARLRANRMAIETDSARGRAAVKADADGLYADLQRHMTTGGPGGGPAVTQPPATIMSRFTEEQQASIARQVDRTIEGQKTRTDRPTWYAIQQGLTGDDANQRERWADINLVQFKDRLSDEDVAALQRLQTAVRNNDGAESRRLQIITRMANQALRKNGIDPTPTPDAVPEEGAAAQAATFHRALQDELLAFENRKSRTATAAEVQDIVDGLMKTAVKGGWIRASDRRSLPVQASDIPATDDAFRENGALLAYVEESVPPGQNRIDIPTDEESFRRSLEEYRQRQAAEQATTGTGGSNGAPATEPDPGSLDYWAADLQARQIVAQQEAEGSGGRNGAPPTEPPPGSPEHLAAESEASKLDESAWNRLGFFQQLGVAFERLDEESKKRGATFEADSKARRLETFLELQQIKDPNVTQKKFLLRNRNIAPDLAGAVGRIIEAQRRLDELPMSDPLRRLFEASSVAEAGRLLREHPGEIARAIGVESVPALTVGLIALAALGPVGGAVTLTGTSGLDGYAKGLVGALARAGVDVSDADALTRALQDKALMERVRKDATTDGAIAAGVTAAAMMIGIRRSKGAARTAAKTPNASPRAGDGATAVAERGLRAPEEILEAPGSLGAARVWTISSRLKANRLPTSGAKIRFVPRKGYDPRNPLPRGPRGGFRDRFGNEWLQGQSRTKGQPFEWDVQLSETGKNQFARFTKKDHLNVSLDGRITHR